jgi:hypothetical protein
MVPQLVIDTTAPPAPSVGLDPADDSGSSASDNVTRVASPRFRGTAEPGATVRVFANGSASPLGSATADGLGNYSVAVVALSDGTYSITVQQLDVAGNVSLMSAVMQPLLVIDTRVPQRPTVGLDPLYDTGTANNGRTAATPARLTGTVEAGNTLLIRDGTTTIDSFTQGTGTSYARDVLLAEGQHSLTVVATDAAGNLNASNTVTITIDRAELDTGRKYVRGLFEQILGRSGSVPDWNYWVGFLSEQDGPFIVSTSIERSREGRTRLVLGWYTRYLGRQPGANEEQFWVNRLVGGQSEEQTLAGLIGSDEYFNRAPSIPESGGGPATNATFVRALYKDLLDRLAAQGEVDFWVGQIASIGREGVAHAILRSTEYRRLAVRGYYTTLLQRATPPGQQELDFWALSEFDLTGIRTRMEASGEYIARVTA